ncbi:MAG: hypothetical protein R3B90_11185 [Planctomycetaceae bacterium]
MLMHARTQTACIAALSSLLWVGLCAGQSVPYGGQGMLPGDCVAGVGDGPLLIAPPRHSPAIIEPWPAPGLREYSTDRISPLPGTPSPAPPYCNFCFEVTEDFANRVLSRQDCNDGPVRDFVLGAEVFGEQTTKTRTRVDFLPCSQAAKLELNLMGQVHSATVGVTPQAHVQTVGQHEFRITKEIEFDGQMIRTRSPAAWVTPSQQNVAAATAVSGVPLLGPIVNNFVLQAAETREPQARQITAEKITRQAVPRFNQEVDKGLAQLNQQLATRVRPTLQQWQLIPQSQQLTSHDRAMQWRVTLGNSAATTPPPMDRSGEPHGEAGMLCLHESLLNGLLDRLPLAGAEVPDAAMDAWFQSLAAGEGLAALARSRGDIRPNLATIIFDRRDPIRFRFDRRRAELVVRIGIRPVAGPEINIQEITIPFEVRVTADRLEFVPEEVSIAAANPQAPEGVLDDPARQVIRREVQSRLQSRSVPRHLPLFFAQTEDAAVMLRSVTFEDGWLTLRAD